MKTWFSAAWTALAAAFAISLVLVTVAFALAVREQKQGGDGRVDVLGMAAATASCGDDGCTVVAGTGWSAVAGASAVLGWACARGRRSPAGAGRATAREGTCPECRLITLVGMS